MLIDTHCHLDFPEYDTDRDEVIERAKAAGVEYIVNVGSSIEGSRRSVDLAKKYPGVYAVVGIHPHEADSVTEETKEEIKALSAKDKVVAIGEAGLDYYRNFSKAENQKPLFIFHIKLAKEKKLPLVMHARQAEADTLDIIKANMSFKGVIHCFSGDEKFLKSCLDLGLYVSFTCNVTYKKAGNLRDIVKLVPLERLMLETDCPYLSPEGSRGKRNEPMQVGLLAREIAAIKGLTFEEISSATTENAGNLFGIRRG
ncbi:TatD family deoxyribonuclease [bacterium]|nr:MAG: TatD family deoxyribonuclease [bacterium]